MADELKKAFEQTEDIEAGSEGTLLEAITKLLSYIAKEKGRSMGMSDDQYQGLLDKLDEVKPKSRATMAPV